MWGLGCEFIWNDGKERRRMEQFLYGSDLEWRIRNLTEKNRNLGVDFDMTLDQRPYSIYAEGRIVSTENDESAVAEIRTVEIYRRWPDSLDLSRVANAELDAHMGAIKEAASARMIEVWREGGGN